MLSLPPMRTAPVVVTLNDELRSWVNAPDHLPAGLRHVPDVLRSSGAPAFAFTAGQAGE
ncbi:hypothetical protein [Streptomyces sp. NPDC002187]|uniref:hypothetical protein n=1 Tax=Streptomyces sp. NPDC002187 TaxID=3364637 RepID=UPI0036CB0C81